MKALSLTQPWAWLVATGLKTIENRTWSTRFRGPFLIHAAKGMTRKQHAEAVDFARRVGLERPIPPRGLLERGGIVGRAELVDVIPPCAAWPCEHPWHMAGQHGFLLRNAESFDFVPCRGMLGFFEVPVGALMPRHPFMQE